MSAFKALEGVGICASIPAGATVSLIVANGGPSTETVTLPRPVFGYEAG